MHTENVAGSLMVLPALVKLRILFVVVAVLSAIPVSVASDFREGDILILSEDRSFLSRFQDQGILLLYELRNQRECGDSLPEVSSCIQKCAKRKYRLPSSKSVYVRGYFRRNGTYVAPHFRRAPNRYGMRSSRRHSTISSHKSVFVRGYFRKDGTYVSPHFRRPPGKARASRRY